MADDNLKNKRALSNDEFYQSGINPYDYHFSKTEGQFIATLDSKRWGKKKNILAYFTTVDGLKIVASHNPNTIGESVANGVDVQISGHTHNGQLFPINFILKFLVQKEIAH